MRTKTVFENSSVELSEPEAEKAKALVEANPFLPFRVNGSALVFNEYTVGELRLGDLCINIKPRNEAFCLQDYFQIIQFLEHPLLSEVEGFGFDTGNRMFNLHDISNQFCFFCDKLLQFGLTGSYAKETNFDRRVSGEIIFSEFRSQLIPHHGLPIENTFFTLDVAANRIVRAALNKLLGIEEEGINGEKYQLLRDFDQISDWSYDEEEVEKIIADHISANPFYLPVLELAKKILFRLQLEYKNGDIEWLAFLENSNSIFEKYIRTVLDQNLPEVVSKWDQPKPFAYLESDARSGKKAYSPDILLNYNQKDSTALLVLDVKNKRYEPSEMSSLNELISSADLYQVMFYCSQLKTKLGGLIYPSTSDNTPVRITFDIDSNLEIYLFSINMRDKMRTRHLKLARDIETFLLQKT